MADESTPPERQFALQKIYIKDVSFETPHSPHIFTVAWDPKVEFNLASNTQPIQEGLFEVTLTVTLTVKIEDKTAYLVEVCQAGIFRCSVSPNRNSDTYSAAIVPTCCSRMPGRLCPTW